MTGVVPPSQLSLNITPRHAYAAENFVVHEGVAQAFEHFSTRAGSGGFVVGYIQGGRRSGKTHFSIRLAEALSNRGIFPRLVEAADFKTLLADVSAPIGCDDVFLIDDAHTYLETLQPGDSGPLVAFVERLRAARATLIFFGDRDLADYAFDEHVGSRLVPGQGHFLGSPAESDMPKIINAVAKQYGMKLSEKKLGFIQRRVGRDVAAVEDYFQRLLHLSQVLGRPIKFPLMSGAV
jgi:chromosomal replication initiation ATPase DnaA